MDIDDFAFLVKLKNQGKTKEQVAAEWEQRKEDKKRETAGIAAELKRFGSEREHALIDCITQVHNDPHLNPQEKKQLIAPLLTEQKGLFDERTGPPADQPPERAAAPEGLIRKCGMQLVELLKAVRDVKNGANDLFRRGQADTAMQEYLRMIWLLQQGSADFDPELVLPSGRIPTCAFDNSEEATELWTVALLNCAAAAVKLQQWPRAKLCARAVLQRQHGHHKALYRLAQALHESGELDEARDTIQQLAAAAPTDAAARKLLKVVNADYKKAQQQFGGMFERGAELYTAEEVARMHAAEEQEQLAHELGAAERRRLARHMTREVHGVEFDRVEQLTSQLPAGTYGVQMDDLIGLSEDQKRKKLGLPPSESSPQPVERPEWMAERHYTQLRSLHEGGCSPDELRREHARLKAEEREWVRENWSIQQESHFECLLEANVANTELDAAFEEIYQEIMVCRAEQQLEIAGCRGDVAGVVTVCVQEQLQQLLEKGVADRELASVLVDRQAEMTLNPLQRRRIKKFEDLVQRVLDGVDSHLDTAQIQIMVGLAKELVNSWLKTGRA